MEKKIVLELNDGHRQLFVYLFNFCFFVTKVVVYVRSKNRQPLDELNKVPGFWQILFLVLGSYNNTEFSCQLFSGSNMIILMIILELNRHKL